MRFGQFIYIRERAGSATRGYRIGVTDTQALLAVAV